jgi:hypothetical protein
MAMLFSISVPKISQTIQNGHIRHIKATMTTQLYELERVVSESITYQRDITFESFQTKNASYSSDNAQLSQLVSEIEGNADYLVYELKIENEKYIVSIAYPSINGLYKGINPQDIDSSNWPQESEVFSVDDSLGLTWLSYNQADKNIDGVYQQVTLIEVLKEVEGVSP